MKKSKNKKQDGKIEIGRNAAIIIGLVIIFVGYYVVNNPITTGAVQSKSKKNHEGVELKWYTLNIR